MSFRARRYLFLIRYDVSKHEFTAGSERSTASGQR